MKRHDIDEKVYQFIIDCFDINYVDKHHSVHSISKDFKITVYKRDIKSNNKISVDMSMVGEFGNSESYEFSNRYSSMLRDYMETKDDHLNSDYIRNKNESVLNFISKIQKV